MSVANAFVYQAVRCAGAKCASVLGETNHWFFVVHTPGHICIYGWNDRLLQDPHAMPVCGQDCAIRTVSGLLGKL